MAGPIMNCASVPWSRFNADDVKEPGGEWGVVHPVKRLSFPIQRLPEAAPFRLVD